MFGGKVLYALQPSAAKAELQYLRYKCSWFWVLQAAQKQDNASVIMMCVTYVAYVDFLDKDMAFLAHEP